MNVTRFDCASIQRLAQILASDPAVPYRAHRDRIGTTNFDHYAVERAARLLCHATGAFETPCGVIAWKMLPWDTGLFRFSAARIDLLAASGGYNEARETASQLIQTAIREAAGKQVRHVVARVDASSLAYSHALAENGFEMIDGIQTFATRQVESNPTPHTRLTTSADTDAIAKIATASFVHDRFHNDITIGAEVADRLHEAWARNSVSGEVADAVLVATSDDGIDAFVTVKLDQTLPGIRFATIPLVATAYQARGKGAARRATAAALDWCASQNVDIVEVGTQIANVPAARLYQSAGFHTTAISLTYRKWID